MGKNIGTIILVLGTILVVALAVMNTAPVTLSLFGAQMGMPLGVGIGVSYVLGVAFTFALLLSRVQAKAASSKKLTEWEQQDQKLLQQVQTDKEKQLEAKIATLEAALQRALKK